MDIRMIAYWIFVVAQLGITFLLFYLSLKILFIMYTLSPLYKKRCPYVPTRDKFMREGFELLGIEPGDKVVDLGSGDGKFLIYGAKRVAADFTGIELNLVLVVISKLKSKFSRFKGTFEVLHDSYMDVPLAGYDKVYFFNMPSRLKELVPKLEKELQSGTRVLSVMFPIKSKRFRRLEEGGTEKYRLLLYEVK